MRHAEERGGDAHIHLKGSSPPEDTDWAQIAALYGVLVASRPDDPILALNAAVALALSGPIEEGLRRLDALRDDGRLATYHLLHAARSDLLGRLGRHDEAREALTTARDLAANPVERAFLEDKLRDS